MDRPITLSSWNLDILRYWGNIHSNKLDRRFHIHSQNRRYKFLYNYAERNLKVKRKEKYFYFSIIVSLHTLWDIVESKSFGAKYRNIENQLTE